MKFRYTKELESPMALRVQSSANKIDDREGKNFFRIVTLPSYRTQFLKPIMYYAQQYRIIISSIHTNIRKRDKRGKIQKLIHEDFCESSGQINNA